MVNENLDYLTIEGKTVTMRLNKLGGNVNLDVIENYPQLKDEYCTYVVNSHNISDIDVKKNRANLLRVTLRFHSSNSLAVILSESEYQIFKMELIAFR
jgi:hypothetical protein